MKALFNNIGIKLKEVYLPFLLVSLGTILGYSLLRWTFDIQLGIIPLKEDLLNIWFPIAIPWIPVLIWMRRRIRILNVRGKQDNGYFLYQLVMVVAITCPLIVSQIYLEKASFELVSVSRVDEVAKHPSEKYFKVESFAVNQSARLPFATSRTSGKNNEHLTFYLYLSSPFEQSEQLWYGVRYKKRISNRMGKSEKNTAYQRFVVESEQKFDAYNFQAVQYFEQLGYSDDRDGFLEAIDAGQADVNASAQIILIPINEPFEDRLGNGFAWTFISFGIGAFVLLLLVVIPYLDEKEWKKFQKGKPMSDDDLKFFLVFLNPFGPNGATAILLLSNLAVFIVMMLAGINIASPTPKELLEMGGNRRSEVLDGEYWRLLTSVFIHGGLVHLFMNLFGLVLGAALLEDLLGKVKLIASFVICGILASLCSIYWHENIVSVGASGAIFGLYGIILVFTVFKIYPNYKRGITWFLLGLFAGGSLLLGFAGGIDNAAHIGGLLSGCAAGGMLILIDKDALAKKAR